MEEDPFVISGPPEVTLPEDLTFGEYIIKQLLRGGRTVAQICSKTGIEMTYDDIRQNSLKLSLILQRLGINKGDVVSIIAENRFEFTVTSIALLLVGAINSPLFHKCRKKEIIHALKITKPVLIFCSSISVADVVSAVKETSPVIKIISYGDEKPDPMVILYKDIFKTDVDPSLFKDVNIDVSTHPGALLCSTGRTLPKYVMLSHNNLANCCFNLSISFQDVIKNGATMLLYFSWDHRVGFLAQFLSLIMNTKQVFLKKYDKELILKTIEKYKVSFVLLVPAMMVFLAKDPLVSKYDLSSLKDIWCGSIALPNKLLVAFVNRMGMKNIIQGYGMTELTIVLGFDAKDNKQGSCGKVMNGMKAKVIDVDSGKSLGHNKEGELCFKGPLTMLGYMGDKVSTDQVIDSDGWFHTRDIAYYDEENYFYIVDNSKGLIKYKGIQFSPVDVEALLLKHPAIKDVGVVGLPDEIAGELPMAFVVLRPGGIATEKEIVDFVATKVSHPKRLHGGVQFLEEIPKNPSGKILRRKLLRMRKLRLKPFL